MNPAATPRSSGADGTEMWRTGTAIDDQPVREDNKSMSIGSKPIESAAGAAPMSTDFVGTNSDKIDKLVATVIELRATLRICFAIIGIGFPLMVSLLVFLVLQSFSNAFKVDRLTDQIIDIKSDYNRINERLNALENPRPR